MELRLTGLDAAIFDMDGVVTRTAETHAAAWKELFDELLAREAPGSRPFDLDRDYRLYVDGKPRYDGVASFLASRNITMPWGTSEDEPGRQTVCGLGNRKDDLFHERLARDGAPVFGSTIAFIGSLRDKGLKTGLFTASRNAREVLAAAHATQLFDEIVDGVEAERLGFPGKPHPAVLLELTRRLKATPARTAVFEDAIAGVQAGSSGHFSAVVGINRGSHTGELLRNGATHEVPDLEELSLVT